MTDTVITYNASNSIQTFVVPEGILSIHVDCIAPKGADSSQKSGGNGGRIQCNMHVTPGQTLYLVVGMTSMAYNASDIRTNNAGITDNNSLLSRLVVAGGGGAGTYAVGTAGGSGGAGGAGGGEIGGKGEDQQGAGGGAGGTQTSGYSFGLGFSSGAGWYGGSEGGHSAWACCTWLSWEYRGGVGGGSSHAAAYCSNVQHTQGYNNTTNGKITITYGDPIKPTPIDVDVNTIITYDDLIGDYISWLRLNCANMDGYTSGVTAPLMTGYTGYLQGTTVPVRVNDNTVIPTVTHETCQSQINTYIANCGLNNKSNQIVKTVDILRYYNALAAFSAAKIVTVCSQLASSKLCMYKSSATAPSVTNLTNVLPTNTQIKTLVQEFTTFVNRSSKMHTITYTIG